MGDYTERRILDILNHQFLKSVRWVTNNLYVYSWESDYLAITKSMYAYEIEVKISVSDYKKDFEKQEKHRILTGFMEAKRQANEALRGMYGRPNYFYYCVPEDMVKVSDIPPYAGLIYVIGNSIRTIRTAPALHKERFDPEVYRMADKFYYNWWGERRKARQLEGKDMKDEFRKSVRKVRRRVESDMTLKAIEAFRNTCDYAYWPDKGYMVRGISPTCSVSGKRCDLRCPRGKEFRNKLK